MTGSLGIVGARLKAGATKWSKSLAVCRGQPIHIPIYYLHPWLSSWTNGVSNLHCFFDAYRPSDFGVDPASGNPDVTAARDIGAEASHICPCVTERGLHL